MTDLLEKIVAPIVDEMSIELYDLELVKEGGVKILRLFIDSEEGVTLTDCENVSRAVEAALDLHDPIPGSYRLQVGSPGIERKLTKPLHYKKNIGKKVNLKLFAPLKLSETVSQKNFSGILSKYDGENTCIEQLDGERRCFLNSLVASCRLLVFDGEQGKQTSKKRRSPENG